MLVDGHWDEVVANSYGSGLIVETLNGTVVGVRKSCSYSIMTGR
jgi:hypothetical protein